MRYLYLSAGAGKSQAERGRQGRDLLGGAILQADRLEGHGMVISISSETPTVQVCGQVAGSQRAWAVVWAQIDGT